MESIRFPVIDLTATGANIVRLRKEKGMTVKDLQHFFGFEEPRAIYKWQRGESLPTVDNLFALSALLGVPMEQILVPAKPASHTVTMQNEQRTSVRCSLSMVGASGCARKIRCLCHFFRSAQPRSRRAAIAGGGTDVKIKTESKRIAFRTNTDMER